MTHLDPSASPDGFVTVPLLTSGVIDDLLELHEQVEHDVAIGFHVTSVNAPRSVARSVDERIKRLVGPLLEAVLEDRRPFLAALITKAPGSGPVEFHQDLTHTDERVHRTVLAWIPLVDTDERNGTMSVVPGSHRWTTGIRPHTVELPTAKHQQRFAEHAVPLELHAGTALLYDAALVHGSAANTSTVDRPAVAVALAPLDAQLLLFTQRSGSALRGYRCEATDFTARPFGSPPIGAERVEPWNSAVSSKDFELVGTSA